VVVANTKEKCLRAEVEKGSTRTAVDRGLIDPKTEINFEKESIWLGFKSTTGWTNVERGSG